MQAPINNIEGLINALKSKEEDPEEFDLLVGMIYESIDKFRNKIRELSDIGKEQEEAKMEVANIEF